MSCEPIIFWGFRDSPYVQNIRQIFELSCKADPDHKQQARFRQHSQRAYISPHKARISESALNSIDIKMTVESSEENVKVQDKLAAAMEESAMAEEGDIAEPKEDPRIAGLIPEVPTAEEVQVPQTKLGPATTITPVAPTTTPPPITPAKTPMAEATPLTKAAEAKQPKRR